MATSHREDRLTAWGFVCFGILALIGGFVKGRQFEHLDSTVTKAFVIVVGIVLIGVTFPVIRSKDNEVLAQATASDTAGGS